MKYEEIALNEVLELSDTELETVAGAGRHQGWSEGNDDNDGSWWRRCRHRNGGHHFGSQDFGNQGYVYGSQDFGGQDFGGQSSEGDDWQHRCRW